MALGLPLRATPAQPGIYFLSQGYHSTHLALDMVGTYRQPVYAMQSGQVFAAEWNGRGWAYGGGYTIILDHFSRGRRSKSAYAHLASMSVARGQYVMRGQLIGYADSTGNSSGHHLHLSFGIATRGDAALYYSYEWVDPRRYFGAHRYANGSQGNGDRFAAADGRCTFVVNSGVNVRADRWVSSAILRRTTAASPMAYLGSVTGSTVNGSNVWYRVFDPALGRGATVHSAFGSLT